MPLAALARDLEELRGLSLSGAVLGTPDFMAPEQIRGEPCGPPADVFALGIVLHLCVTGRHPFPAQSLPQRLNASTEAHPASVEASLPRDLRAILHKALEASPARRYRSAGELAEDLRRWVDGRPVMAQPPDVFYLLRKFAVRHRSAVAAATLVLLSAAAAALWHWHSQNQAERELRAQYAETLLVSAELHGQRGQWIPALEEIGKAEAAGARDPGRTALARVEALLAAGRRDDARRVLSGLNAATLTAYPGLVDYWRAQLIDGAAGTDEAAGLLRRAEAAGLPPAQRLICAAMLSDDEAETEARLLDAVQLEPWNHQALLLHAFALAFTGRDAEALSAAASAARLFPQSRDLAFCTHLIQARSGSAPAEKSDDPIIADMHFLQQQRAGIYDLAWQRGGNAITRVLKAKSILSRVNASPLFGKRDAAEAAGEAVPALVLRFMLRLHERELRSVQLLHEKPQNPAALREMLEAEHRRSRPSVIVICHCASALLIPALSDDKLSSLIEAACGRMAADPAILDAERALMLEMCATQTLYRLPGSTDPALRTRSTDYVRRRLAVPIPCASLPASVLSQGMVACGEFALARSCAEAARSDAPNDAGIILQQATVEQKAGQWQRCIEFTGQLPANAPAKIRQQMDQIRAEAVVQLQELARKLSEPR